MSFVVQDATGEVAGANAYITVADFRAYHEDRGGCPEGTDGEIEAAIVKVTDYVDGRFRFVGGVLTDAQTTSWPRRSAYDREGRLVEGIPEVLREAVAEYALVELTTPGTLYPEPVAESVSLRTRRTRVKAGPVEKEVEYFGGSEAPAGAPRPVVLRGDDRLRASGLVVTGGRAIRA